MHNETKQILLKVTRDLIDTEGINAISMRTVGGLAGLSRTALYRHFENKESLLAAIVVENFIILGEKFNILEGDCKNPGRFLFELFIAYYDFGIHNPDHYQLMFSTKWDTGKYPDIRLAAISIFNKVAHLVSEALQFKPSDPKIPIEKTAILYAFIHGIVELHLAGHDEVSKGLNEVRPLIDHILEAILKM
jgi:AcrR family transcriptional regulator